MFYLFGAVLKSDLPEIQQTLRPQFSRQIPANNYRPLWPSSLERQFRIQGEAHYRSLEL